MADYYVRTDGNDANDGLADDPARAWRTLQHAADTAATGSTIHVRGGTYTAGLALSAMHNGKTLTFVGHDGTVTVFPTSGYALNAEAAVDATCVFSFANMTFLSGFVAIVRITGAPKLSFTDCAIGNPETGAVYLFQGVTAAAGTPRTLALTRCVLYSRGHAIYPGNYAAITLDGCTIAFANTRFGHALRLDGASVGTVTVRDCEITQGPPTVPLTGSVLYAVGATSIGRLTFVGNTVSCSGSAVVADGNVASYLIDNNIITCDGTLHAIHLGTDDVNVATYLIDNNTITCDGASHAIHLGTADVNVATYLIDNNTITCDSTSHALHLGTADVNAAPNGTAGPMVISRNRITVTGGNAHCMLIGKGNSGVEIWGNSLTGGNYGLVVKADHAHVHHNTMIGRSPLALKGAKRCTVHHCTAVGTAGQGALEWEVQPDLGSGAANAEYNNVHDCIFVATGATTYAVYDVSGNHQGNRLDRNIYWSSGGAGIAYLDGAERNTIEEIRATWDSWNEAVPLNGTTYGLAFSENDDNSSVTDPLLVNVAASDLRIKLNSPARGTQNATTPDLSVWNTKGAWEVFSARPVR